MATLETRLRRRIGELLLDGETEASAADWETYAHSSVAPATFTRWLLEAARYIAASVRPDVLGPLHTTDTTPGDSLALVSVEAGTERLTRRSHRGMALRPSDDAYVFEDGRVALPSGFSASATYRVVQPPTSATDLPDFLQAAAVEEAASYALLAIGGDTSLAQSKANALIAPYLPARP